MNDKSKLFDYVERDNFIYNLSGITKIICLLLLSFTVMLSYDIRVIAVVMVLALVLFAKSELAWKQVRLMIAYIGVFLILNLILTYLFSPMYGVEIYGTYHEVFRFNNHFILTLEQIMYEVSKVFKYMTIVPIGLIFFLTTNPSEFASSMNKIGLSYKGCYALALTLRYFPDLVREFKDITLAQQSRGIDLSSKEKLSRRVGHVVSIIIPLVLSTLDRIDTVGNAMDLRGFGKNKKRTWYSGRPMKAGDYVSIVISVLIFAFSIYMSVCVNHSRFYNPFL